MSRATLVAAFLAVLHSSICIADEGSPTIVLLSMLECCPEEVWPEAEKAMLDEFDAIGLSVLIVQNASEIRLQAEKHGAACVMRIVRLPDFSKGHVEIWTSAGAGGASAVQLLNSNGKPDSEEAQILALRIIEVFRESQNQVVPKEPKKSDLEVIRESHEFGPETRPHREQLHKVVISLGAGTVTSLGKIGTMGSLTAAIRWNPDEELSLELSGSNTLFGPKIEEGSSNANFGMASVRVWAIYNPPSEKIFRPGLGIGAGLLMPWWSGKSSIEYASKFDMVPTGYVGITGQLEIALADNLGLRLVVRYGIGLPEVNVKFGNKEVAYFGRLLLESNMSFEYRI